MVNSTYLEEYKALSHQSLICGTGYQFTFLNDKGTIDIVNVRAQPFDVVDNKFSFKRKISSTFIIKQELVCP